MPDAFEIIVPTAEVELPADRTGAVTVDVTSRLSRNTRVGVQVLPAEGATPEWFGPPDPAEYDSRAGETRQVRVPVAVSATAPAGTTSFRLRAYAVDNPSVDYTASAPVAVVVPAAPEPRGIPAWLLAVVAVVVVALVGGGLYLLLREDGADIAGVVGRPLGEALDDLDDDLEKVVYTDGTVTPARSEEDGCVLLQIPPGGQTSVRVGLLVTRCPLPGPQLPTMTVLEDLCAVEGFCEEIVDHFGDLEDNDNWDETRSAQFDQFVETFLEPGVDSPSLVGTQVDPTLTVPDLSLRYVSDGATGTTCVLFQYPPPAVEVRRGATVTALITGCPEVEISPDRVTISTPVDLTTYADLCTTAGGAAFCEAVANDPLQPPGFVGSEGFVAMLEAQEALFRQSFTRPMVPDLAGLTESQARSLLAVVDLELEVDLVLHPILDPFELSFVYCPVVVSQTPGPGTELDDVPGSEVHVQMSLQRAVGCGLIDIGVIEGVRDAVFQPVQPIGR